MFVLILLLQLFVCVYSKEACLHISNCKCKHSKGIVDLSPLHGQSFKATTKQQNRSLEFTFFPCEQTQDLGYGCHTSENNAVCLKDESDYVSYGVEASVKFIVPNTNDYSAILAKFTPLSGKHPSSEVYIRCQHDRTTTTTLIVNEVQNNNVQLELKSIHACFTPYDPIGSWYLLVTVMVLLVVTVTGVLTTITICRYSQGVRGVYLINHKDVCIGLFKLGIDGVRTVFSCFPVCRNKIGVSVRDRYSPIREIQNNC